MRNVLSAQELATAIEVAEHNGRVDDGRLIVWDGSVMDRHYGVTITVEPNTSSVGGWIAVAWDGVGHSANSHRMDRHEAVLAAYTAFLGLNAASIRQGQTSLAV